MGDILQKGRIMNITFLIFSFNVGGIERLLIDMANNMAERGNNITLCVINDDYDAELLGKLDAKVDVVRLNRKIGDKASFKYMIRLAKILRQKKTDILHCQGINCVLFSALVYKLVIYSAAPDNGCSCGAAGPKSVLTFPPNACNSNDPEYVPTA